MKDIRLIEISPGRIAVFTRPQGKIGGRGKIAYIEISSFDELEPAIPRAEIIQNQFSDSDWGGANELHLLKNGRIGVLGHIAHFHPCHCQDLDMSGDEAISRITSLQHHIARNDDTEKINRKSGYHVKIRHYYAMAFCFDPEDKKASAMEILASARDFPVMESKKPELGNIVFSGGLERLPDGMARLYAGIGDVAAGCVTIPDPFSKYEK